VLHEPFIAPLHIAVTAYMTGVLWFVQLIQYPWFHEVPSHRFSDYHRRYTQRMGFLVGPAMLVELTSGMALLVLDLTPARGLLVVSLILLAIGWLSTFLLQVPCHQKLSKGYDAGVHHRLVVTNWIRTVAWSARLVLVIIIMVTSN